MVSKSGNFFPKTIFRFFFCFYILWNMFWLSKLQFPPSILTYYTGFPCPTTGCIRSITSLARGNTLDFFLYNPFTFPFLGLLVTTVVIFFGQLIRGKQLLIKQPLVNVWFFTLFVSWLSKFIIGKNYW